MKKPLRLSLGLFLLLPLLVNGLFIKGKTGTPSNAPAALPSARRVTVMTWNVHGGNPVTRTPSGTNNQCVNIPKDANWGMQKVADVINYTNASGRKIDVLAVQEIHREQVKKLAALIHYRYTQFIWTLSCVEKPRNPETSKKDYGNAILSPYPLELEEIYMLPTQTSGKDKGPSDADRGEFTRMGAVAINLSDAGKLRIYNTHLTANPTIAKSHTHTDKEHQDWLNLQVDSVFKRIREDEDKYGAMYQSVLMLDFNTRSDTDPYRHMIDPKRGSPFADVWTWGRTNPPPGYTFPAQDPNGPQGRYDDIFVKNQPPLRYFNVLYAETIGICSKLSKDGKSTCIEWRSDHLPVIATLALNDMVAK
jgi:endonuclease/exonuclease/phosphatase family metal-dependent hydrolase